MKRARTVVSALSFLVALLRAASLIGDDTTIVTMDGINCATPHHVVFPLWGDFLRIDSLSTCQHGNDYSSTCLGPYDGGEDYLIELEVMFPAHFLIGLEPQGTSWTGIALDRVCPPGASCIEISTATGSNPHWLTPTFLEPGTYYLMIDTWPSPNCIPQFAVTFERVFSDPFGVDCVSPFNLELNQSSLPQTYGPFSTYGMGNELTESCLGAYDAGIDVFHRLVLPQALYVDISLDPAGQPGSAFLIDDECPPDEKCIASATDSTGQTFGIDNLFLAAGTYYLIVDSWSSAILEDCTLNFDLSYICGDANSDQMISISDAIYEVAYIFAGGPAPDPLPAGDADNDGSVTISDAVYLIAYIFSGGMPPCVG